MVGYQPGRTERLIEDFLLGRGVRPRMVFRSNDNGAVQAMVAAGLGVALAPLLAVDQTDRRIALVELAEPVPPRILVLLWHRDRYRLPAADAFVETAVGVAAQIERNLDAAMKKIRR
jgi:DNA-binding transcriptional LysR family regulator